MGVRGLIAFLRQLLRDKGLQDHSGLYQPMSRDFIIKALGTVGVDPTNSILVVDEGLLLFYDTGSRWVCGGEMRSVFRHMCEVLRILLRSTLELHVVCDGPGFQDADKDPERDRRRRNLGDNLQQQIRWLTNTTGRELSDRIALRSASQLNRYLLHMAISEVNSEFEGAKILTEMCADDADSSLMWLACILRTRAPVVIATGDSDFLAARFLPDKNVGVLYFAHIDQVDEGAENPYFIYTLDDDIRPILLGDKFRLEALARIVKGSDLSERLLPDVRKEFLWRIRKMWEDNFFRGEEDSDGENYEVSLDPRVLDPPSLDPPSAEDKKRGVPRITLCLIKPNILVFVRQGLIRATYPFLFPSGRDNFVQLIRPFLETCDADNPDLSWGELRRSTTEVVSCDVQLNQLPRTMLTVIAKRVLPYKYHFPLFYPGGQRKSARQLMESGFLRDVHDRMVHCTFGRVAPNRDALQSLEDTLCQVICTVGGENLAPICINKRLDELEWYFHHKNDGLQCLRRVLLGVERDLDDCEEEEQEEPDAWHLMIECCQQAQGSFPALAKFFRAFSSLPFPLESDDDEEEGILHNLAMVRRSEDFVALRGTYFAGMSLFQELLPLCLDLVAFLGLEQEGRTLKSQVTSFSGSRVLAMCKEKFTEFVVEESQETASAAVASAEGGRKEMDDVEEEGEVPTGLTAVRGTEPDPIEDRAVRPRRAQRRNRRPRNANSGKKRTKKKKSSKKTARRNKKGRLRKPHRR